MYFDEVGDGIFSLDDKTAVFENNIALAKDGDKEAFISIIEEYKGWRTQQYTPLLIRLWFSYIFIWFAQFPLSCIRPVILIDVPAKIDKAPIISNTLNNWLEITGSLPKPDFITT